MTYKSLCYHGTSLQNAESILEKGFKISCGNDHWLGDGVYFFENDGEMAIDWCIAEGSKRGYNKYVVLHSEICASEEYIYNLTEPEGRKLFHEFRRIFINKVAKGEYSVGIKNKHVLDGAIINKLCQLFPYKLIISSMFVQQVEDRRKKDFSRIPNCVIVCVRDVTFCNNDIQIYKEGVINE